MNAKSKLPKNKLKTSPKKQQLVTPRKMPSTKHHTSKQRTPTTISTKCNLTATMKKILRSPSMTLHNITAENRESLISMLITESSNVPLDSPLFSEFDVSQPDDELIELVRNRQIKEEIEFLNQKDEAAIKIQRFWRWFRTKNIVNDFMNKQITQDSITSNLQDYIHRPIISQQNRITSSQSQINLIKNGLYQRLPNIDFLRFSDLNKLLSSQSFFARKKFDSQTYIAKQQLEMDVISQNQYKEQVTLFKQVYNRKQKELLEYSKLASTVMKDIKKIVCQLHVQKNIIKNKKRGMKKCVSNQQFISTFKLTKQIDSLIKKDVITIESISPKHSLQFIQQQQFKKVLSIEVDQQIQKKIEQQYRNQLQNKIIQQPTKVNSISVSAETIEAVCKKLLRFGLNNKKQYFDNLYIPLGMTPKQLLNAYHNTDDQIPAQDDVLPGKLFEQFEKMYLKEMEVQALKQGKILTVQFKRYIHFHNQAIFDVINEALETQRKYGINGYPLPWKSTRLVNTNPDLQKSLLKVIDYVLDCEDCHCGYLSQHFHKLNPQLPLGLLLQVRAQKQLIAQMLELRNERQDWINYDINEAFLLLDIDTILCEYIFMQAANEIKKILQQ